MKHRTLFIVLVLCLVAPAFADLKPGDTVAICGDSITEQKDYSVNIESYLLMCQPAANLRTVQFGWGGETSWGFLDRMENDVFWSKPNVATTCYGMNDGGYGPLGEDRAKQYRQAQSGIVKKFKQAGVRLIIVGSPGCVDADTFRRNRDAAAVYNKTLSQLRDIARSVAQDEGVAFANVFDPMIDVMTKAKSKYGNAYHLAGGDGVHPGRNGHLVMAYAYLKAMGCDGAIGTIRVDLGGSKAEASAGHTVVSANAGTVEIESSRYPFCFFGEAASPDSTRGILEFLPFNDELNRFELVVTNAQTDKLKITWGNASKVYSASDLAKGINLAAEFLDNPFCEKFQAVQKVIREQQGFETPLHKTMLHAIPNYRANLPEEGATLDRLVSALARRDEGLAKASSAAVTPVKHTIRIEAVK